ncbi:MAG: response regulator [Bryobacterales bacterium]|nr:response regulator [Bryobacteraceae bacterium]MDW8354418.1 response regulator [Bryobacterales bacterium]
MSRILLADDSPHAQRMGERILRDEGYEVVTVTDGAAAVVRLADVDPDLVVADALLPERSGYEIARYVKSHPAHRHVRVVLTAGALDPIDEAELRSCQADAVLQKPFEASVVIETIRPLVEAARAARQIYAAVSTPNGPIDPDPERVRAAVTLALDAAMPRLIDELTARVLDALKR